MDIKTNFVKNEIKGRKYNDRNFKYIEDLNAIERLIKEKRKNMAAHMKFESLKRNYPVEFAKIYEELDPKGWDLYKLNKIKEAKIKKEEEIALRRLRIEEENIEKEFWKKHGGKL